MQQLTIPEFMEMMKGKTVYIYWPYSKTDGDSFAVDKTKFLKRLKEMECTGITCAIPSNYQAIYVQSLEF
jgi:hypothetical protein